MKHWRFLLPILLLLLVSPHLPYGRLGQATGSLGFEDTFMHAAQELL